MNRRLFEKGLLKVTISIVSHGHDVLVQNLLAQLAEHDKHIVKVILTQNISCDVDYDNEGFSFELVCLNNREPLGFGANHNRAFSLCDTEYFCVMNPDIVLNNDPFENLLKCGRGDDIAVTAPIVTNFQGDIEDSARYFPTPLDLVKKLFGMYKGNFPINMTNEMTCPEWVGGMFMLIKADKYAALSGFDESYFLYYEDVDFCLRAWRRGYKVVLCKSATVIHDARRDSRRNIKFLKWHLSSAATFFIKHGGRFPETDV